MANDKTYDRHVNIWINGKEVINNISSIKKEMYNLTNEVGLATRGSKEYNEKAAELEKVNQILKEHRKNIAATGTAWDKIKGAASSSLGIITAGIGIAVGMFQSFKGIIESTDASSDRFAIAMGGVKEAINAASRAMATGNFKHFFRDIKDAVTEGQRYADTQDAIGDSARALALEEDRVASKILDLRIIQNDARKSDEERIKAGEKIERISQELADKRVVQAKKNFDNLMTNARFRTKLDDETIMGLLNQDAAYEKVFTTGKKYYDLAQEAKTASATRVLAINSETKNISDAEKAAAAIYSRWQNLTDANKDHLIEAQKAIGDAERSAKENIIRVITKTNSEKEKLDKDSTKKFKDNLKEKTKAEREAKVESAQIAADVEEYEKNLDENYFKRLDKKQEAERKAKVESAQIAADVEAYEKELDKNYFDRLDKKKKAQEDYDNELFAAKKELISNLGGLESALFDSQFANLDAKYKKDIAAAGDNADAKAKIDIKYNKKRNALLRKAAIADKLAALFSIGLDTAKGVVKALAELHPVLAALIIANGVANAAIVAAKPIPNYFKGGPTGRGGKYEPAGIIHKNEWVANADMVASPVIGPVIRALEEYRVNMPEYANGGGTGNECLRIRIWWCRSCLGWFESKTGSSY